MVPIDSHQHPLAGISFPATIGGLVLDEVHQYDDWGHNLSAGYSWPAGASDTELTYYVYPAGEGTAADQMQQALLDVQQVNANTQILAHAPTRVNGLEGLRVDLLLTPMAKAGQGVPSTVLVFKTDGWFIKVRSTAGTASPQLACGTSAEDLMRHLGIPNTRRRLDVGLRTAASAAEAAMVALSRACEAEDGEGADPGGQMRAALRDLEGGEFLGAMERYLSMEEEGHAGAPLVEGALRAYLPAAVTFAGGFGTSLGNRVVVSNVRTDGEQVAAGRRYLESVLGSPVVSWQVERCDVLLTGDSLLDACHLKAPSAHPLVLFFKVGDVPAESRSSAVTILGGVDLTSGDKSASFSVADNVPEGLAKFIMTHLANHTAQNLLRE